MRTPQQKRSEESLERVIEASEQILRSRSAEDLTIARIVEESGVSVGSIYGRFSSKDDVFHELTSRFMRRTLSEFEAIDHEEWAEKPLTEFIDEVVAINADIYFAHRGVLRAILVRTRLAQDSALIKAGANYNRKVGSMLLDLFMAHAHEIEHSDPEEAANVSIEAMTALLREAIIFGNRTTLDLRAVRRLQDLLKRYLTLGAP